MISGASLELALLRFVSVSDSSSIYVIYPNTDISLTTGAATANTPEYANVTSFAVTPTLPDGLSLDTSTGSISGTPTTSQDRTEYTIIARNDNGESTTVQFFITISSTAISLFYSSASYAYAVGSSVSIAATTSGTITSCTSSPSLPSSLAIDSSNCNISGVPNSTSSDTTYTITASNDSNSTSTSFSLVIDSSSISISYSQAYSYSVGDSVSITPTTSGTITSCTSSPSLPSSLSLDSTSCAITGTATVMSEDTTYTITASNSVTSSSTSTNIAIDNTWVQDAYLKASNASSSNFFGFSVAMGSSYAIVGSYGESNSSTAINNTDNGSITVTGTAANAGAAYVFKRDSSGDWIQDTYLKSSNLGLGDQFGRSVSINGDYAIVSARYEDNNLASIINTDASPSSDSGGAGNSGAAYIFKRDSTTGDWSQDAYLKASNSGINDYFASVVAIYGNTAVVTALGEDNDSTSIVNTDNASITDSGTALESGAAYIFKRNTVGGWDQDAYLKASNSEDNDFFGTTAAISSDYIVIGAHLENNASTSINNTDDTSITDSGTAASSGAAYVFKKDSGGNWIQDAYLKASNTGAADRFGQSVAIRDDYIIVGAINESNTSTSINNTDNTSITDIATGGNLGAAYIFKRDSTTGDWSQDAYLKASNAENNDYFGSSVAISGNYAIVSALGESNSSTSINNTDNASITDAGTATSSGAVYIFKRNSTTGDWSQDAYLKASNAEASDSFGNSIAIDGDYIIVGAYSEGNGSTSINNTDNASITDASSASQAGAAYIFRRK
ncbi:MAG: putative Ig domain-containing protein [Spirochaetota bacterium]